MAKKKIEQSVKAEIKGVDEVVEVVEVVETDKVIQRAKWGRDVPVSLSDGLLDKRKEVEVDDGVWDKPEGDYIQDPEGGKLGGELVAGRVIYDLPKKYSSTKKKSRWVIRASMLGGLDVNQHRREYLLLRAYELGVLLDKDFNIVSREDYHEVGNKIGSVKYNDIKKAWAQVMHIARKENYLIQVLGAERVSTIGPSAEALDAQATVIGEDVYTKSKQTYLVNRDLFPGALVLCPDGRLATVMWIKFRKVYVHYLGDIVKDIQDLWGLRGVKLTDHWLTELGFVEVNGIWTRNVIGWAVDKEGAFGVEMNNAYKPTLRDNLEGAEDDGSLGGDDYKGFGKRFMFALQGTSKGVRLFTKARGSEERIPASKWLRSVHSVQSLWYNLCEEDLKISKTVLDDEEYN